MPAFIAKDDGNKVELPSTEWKRLMAYVERLECDAIVSAYLVWSHEHRAWWRPMRNGYTTNIAHAGVYSRDDAMEITKGATLDWSKPPNEVPVQIDALPDEAKSLLGML